MIVALKKKKKKIVRVVLTSFRRFVGHLKALRPKFVLNCELLLIVSTA